MGWQHLSWVSSTHSLLLCSSHTGLISYSLSWSGPGLWVCALAILCACRRTVWTRPLQRWVPLVFRSHFICQSLPSGSFHKPLFLLCQRADRMKTTIRENYPNWSHGPQPCLTQWNYEPCCVWPPKTDGSWWRVLTKCGPLEKGTANHFSILASRIPWTVWKVKKIQPPTSVGVQYATGKESRNSSRKNEEAGPKQKQCAIINVTGGESKFPCCKE